MSNAIYIKCKPQKCDLWPLVEREKKVFIGYPPWLKDRDWNRHDVHSCIQDLSKSTSHEMLAPLRRGYRAQISANSWYVDNMSKGDFVYVPRPSYGLCYIGKVDSSFKLAQNPGWADDYLALRKNQSLEFLPEEHHLADVVQYWDIESFQAVPLPMIPRWITYRLLSRNSIGVIYDQPNNSGSAARISKALFDGTFSFKLTPTLDSCCIKNRLLNWLTPTSFEHLACELLRFEYPSHRWWHIGGSGDGGIDGIAIDEEERIPAVLQCKWKYNGNPVDLGKQVLVELSKTWKEKLRGQPEVFVAVLYPNEKRYRLEEQSIEYANGRVTLLDVDWFANKILEHRDRSSFALALGIV